MSNCGKCHRCGTPLQRVLDGEEWCPKCQQYRRYRSHGWVGAGVDRSPCPDGTEQLKARIAELEAENIGLTSRVAALQAEDARHARQVATLHLIIRAADEDKLLAIEALDGDNRRLMDAMYKARAEAEQLRARVADLEADRNETLEILKAYFDMDIVMPDDKLATLVRVAIAKAEEAERKSEELEAMTLDDHLYRKVGQIADFVEATLKKTEADDETR